MWSLFFAAVRGCQLEEAMAAVSNAVPQEVLGLAEGLGDLYCKVGCYTKALEAYHTQVLRLNCIVKKQRKMISAR